MRRISGFVAVLVLFIVTAFAAVPAAGAKKKGSSGASYASAGQVLNVLPPGSRGNISGPGLLSLGIANLPNFLSTPGDPQGALATASPTTPPNFANQLEMYDALGKTSPGQLNESNLTDYFKDARIGVDAADVESSETPQPGVTIKRDKFGVPHITGDTFENVMFGAGYANIQDRMFLTDILRHTGAARMAEFVGPSESNIAMDRSQLRIAPYTEQQAKQQIAEVAARHGDEGAKMLRGLDAMVEGMNAAQNALCPLSTPAVIPGLVGFGFGPSCPVEYAALQKPPQPYTRSDIVHIASLVGGIFGKGGGGEFGNAIWLHKLRDKYGPATANKIFDDLREKNDPEAPTTSPTSQPYGGGAVDPSKPGVALPDLNPSATAPGTGADAGGSSMPIPTEPPGIELDPSTLPNLGVVDGPLGPIDLNLQNRGLSNALLVSAKESADGRPNAVFGPQTGYFTPQLLVEQSLSGPGVQARGVSFAGTNLVVQLGHGVDYAWSATSASNDIVDTVIERLCNTDGSAATVNSTGYLNGGECVEIEQYVHEETSVGNAAAPAPPQRLRFLVLKTRHGIVQLRTTVGGKPVAVVTERTTYNHELDSAVGFARLQDPDYVKDAKTFQKAVSAIDYTFNWFYADDRDIAYFSSGLLPRRAEGIDWDLPRWGDSAYDHQGALPFSAHPRTINPPFMTSWNNKPAPDFSAADSSWGYGSVYRSQALDDRIKSRTRGKRKINRADLTEAMIDAATVDLRAAKVLPGVLDVIGAPADEQDAKAVRLLRDWIADGGHRVDRDRDRSYSHQAAIRLLDIWWQPNAAGLSGESFSLPKDALRGELGNLVDQLPAGLDDHPRHGIGSAWNGIAWYGFLEKGLRQIRGLPVNGPYSRTYCGDGTLTSCTITLRDSLHAAVQAALASQAKTDVSQLTYDKSEDFIRHSTAGVIGVRPIDWQNRPTFQQTVHYTSHRARPTARKSGKKSPRNRG